MELSDPPSDPFEGMTAQERKRAQELATLEMAYEVRSFAEVESRERPDFALRRRSEDDEAFGVEITNLFPNQSDARLHLVHGYHHRLWSGGSHLHRDDIANLQSVTVTIRDKDGNVKQTDVPAIISERPGLPEFRTALAECIRGKAAKRYQTDLTHINLVVLDWYDLGLTTKEYSSDRFFDEEVRETLRLCPFREVFIIVAGDDSDGNMSSSAHPYRRVIPLRQLLAMERMFVTGHVVDQEAGGLRDAEHLNSLVVDHVSRVQHVGQAVMEGGHPYLQFGSTSIRIAAEGMEVRDHQDLPLDLKPLEAMERLSPDTEQKVFDRASTQFLRCGYAPRANKSSIWIER